MTWGLVLWAVAAAAADQPQKLFPVPPMPPLGANKWSTTPITVLLFPVGDAELPKTAPAAEPHLIDGQLPIPNAKGAPIAVRREKDAGGNETGLGIDSSGAGTFFVKVPLDKANQGRVITFELPRGNDAQTQRPKVERYAMRIFPSDGNWSCQRSGALKGTALGQPIYLFDTNLNGRFDDVGVDQLIVGNTEAQPFSDLITLNNIRYSMKLDAGGGGPLTLTPNPYPDTLARGLEHVNRWREQLGLAPMKLHDEISRWAQCHLDFLIKNNVTGLGEDPAMPRYTKEGAWAGGHSCCIAGPQDITAGLNVFIDSAFHRIPLLSPYITVTGLAFAAADPNIPNSIPETAIDVGSTGDSGIEWLEPIACPGDGQTSVPNVWSGFENPGPLNGDPPPEGVGYAITLTFPSHKAKANASIVTSGESESDMPRDVVCQLKEDAPGADPIDAFFSDPQHPAQPAVHGDNLASVIIVPKTPLKPDTIFVVTVQCTWRRAAYKKVWRFGTGNAQFNPPVKPDPLPIWKRVSAPPLPAK